MSLKETIMTILEKELSLLNLRSFPFYRLHGWRLILLRSQKNNNSHFFMHLLLAITINVSIVWYVTVAVFYFFPFHFRPFSHPLFFQPMLFIPFFLIRSIPFSTPLPSSTISIPFPLSPYSGLAWLYTLLHCLTVTWFFELKRSVNFIVNFPQQHKIM